MLLYGALTTTVHKSTITGVQIGKPPRMTSDELKASRNQRPTNHCATRLYAQPIFFPPLPVKRLGLVSTVAQKKLHEFPKPAKLNHEISPTKQKKTGGRG